MSDGQNLPFAPDEQRQGAPLIPIGDGDFGGWIVGVFRRQFIIIAVCSVLGLSCGLAYLFLTPRTYVAQTEILFERVGRPTISQQPVAMDSSFDTGFFESQLKILQSERIAQKVVERLDLENDPEFAGSGGGLLGKIYGLFSRSAQPESALTKADRVEAAAAAVAQKLDAKRIGITFIIEISCQSKNPARASEIVNAVADAYIADQIESKRESARQANEWLRSRLDDLRARAAADEQAVNAYQAEHQIVHAGGTLIDQQALSALNNELAAARTKKSEALARLDRIETVLNASDPNVAASATVSDALNHPVITQLRQAYLELASRASEYTNRYGSQHLAVVRIHEKMRNVQLSIISELRRLAETARSEYLIAKRRNEEIEKELATSVTQSQATDRAQVALRDLESAAQSSRALFNLFQQRLVESTQEQALQFNDVRKIRAATVSNQKRAPKIIGFSVLAGLMIGGGIGFLRELMDRVFRTSKQVENILHLPCVAIVPALAQDDEIVVDKPTPSGPGSRLIAYRSLAINIVLYDRLSYLRESIRSIKLAADLTATHDASTESIRPGAIVGIVSALQGEGKSTISLVFSQFSAQSGQPVILIDFDYRNPSVTRRLAPNANLGILDVLSGRCSIDDVLWIDHETNMTFLPMSRPAASLEPSHVLASTAAKKLLEDLRRRYSYVVIDLPPIMPLADVRATAHLIDYYFLIVEWGRTKIDIVTRTLVAAPNVSSKMLGVVLNKTDMDYIGRYDPFSYSEYYDQPDR